jgi:transcription-repair coupling factor (superfamily II helicase)
VPGGARAFAIAGLADQLSEMLLVVVPGERDADELADDIALFLDDVTLAPAWETLPFEHVSPNIATMSRRAAARHRLARGGGPAVVVASVRSAIQRLSPSSPDPLVLLRNDEIALDDLVRELADLGYSRTDRVEGRGEFAVRGGIVDVFPAQAEEPVRLDFWGDTVEDIRVISVATQRSEDPVDQLIAYPAREVRPVGPMLDRASRLVVTEPRLQHGIASHRGSCSPASSRGSPGWRNRSR